MANAILLALAPVFFVMALGYGAGRLHIVDNHQVDGLNALVMDFALPASLFVATASAPRSEMFTQAPLFAILGAVMLLLYLAWFSFMRACLMLIGHAAAGVALFLTGLILSAQSFRLDWRVVGATGMVDIIRPLLTVAVVLVLPVSAETAKVAILLAAVPSGFFGILFAVNYRLATAIAVLFPQ